MIKIFRKTPDGQRHDLIKTGDPIKAEAHYFELSRLRTDGPEAIIISTDLPGVVRPAYFRLDHRWHSWREQDIDRKHQLWGPVGDWARPTEIQIMALSRVLGWAGRADRGAGKMAAYHLGISARTWRAWVGHAKGGSQNTRPIPWTAWLAMLFLAGLITADMIVLYNMSAPLTRG